MYAALGLLAVLSCAAAEPPVYQSILDDGAYHPEADGSNQGNGNIRYGADDGSWKPHLDGSYLGRGDLRTKRDASSQLPVDEPVVAHAKNTLLRQQYIEGQRNILGGGVPDEFPADTPEVAQGKRDHAIAHENQKLATSAGRHLTPIHHVTSIVPAPVPVYSPVAHIASPVVARTYSHVAHVAQAYSPVAHVATPFAHAYSPVAHVGTPVVARAYSPVAHVGTPVVARAYSPVAHVATPFTAQAYSHVAHVGTPVAAQAYSPIAHVATPTHFHL